MRLINFGKSVLNGSTNFATLPFWEACKITSPGLNGKLPGLLKVKSSAICLYSCGFHDIAFDVSPVTVHLSLDKSAAANSLLNFIIDSSRAAKPYSSVETNWSYLVFASIYCLTRTVSSGVKIFSGIGCRSGRPALRWVVYFHCLVSKSNTLVLGLISPNAARTWSM